MSHDNNNNKEHIGVTVHMLVSLDGKTSGEALTWSETHGDLQQYYRIDHDVLKARSQVCLCGRKSVEPLVDVEDPKNYPAADRKGDRSDFHADLATNPAPPTNHYFTMVDPHGRLGWKENTFSHKEFPFYNGDRIVEVLVEDFVTDEFLAQLRKVNVPYIFAGKSQLDFRVALEKLGKLFNTNHVVCHGGGTVNGTLLEQGVVDHLSVLLLPVVSGDPDAVSFFNPLPGGKLPMKEFDLEQVEKLEGGSLWLQYARKA